MVAAPVAAIAHDEQSACRLRHFWGRRSSRPLRGMKASRPADLTVKHLQGHRGVKINLGVRIGINTPSDHEKSGQGDATHTVGRSAQK